jgi:hypothetical protein
MTTSSPTSSIKEEDEVKKGDSKIRRVYKKLGGYKIQIEKMMKIIEKLETEPRESTSKDEKENLLKELENIKGSMNAILALEALNTKKTELVELNSKIAEHEKMLQMEDVNTFEKKITKTQYDFYRISIPWLEEEKQTILDIPRYILKKSMRTWLKK